MEPLNLTPIPPSPLPPLPVGRKLSAWLRQRDFILRALFALAALSLLVAFAAFLVALFLTQKRTQFVALMPDGNIVLAEGTDFEDARELHKEAALLATAALLTRGPKGFDLVEMLPRVFSRQTQGLAEQLRQNEHSEFSERQWQQKPVIAQVEIMETRGASLEVHVTGQIVRSGPFAGQVTESVVPFTLWLTFTRNRDLLRSRHYPLLVTAFTLSYETARP